MRRGSPKAKTRAKARMGTKIKAKRIMMVRKSRPTQMENLKGRKTIELVDVSFVMVPKKPKIVSNMRNSLP